MKHQIEFALGFTDHTWQERISEVPEEIFNAEVEDEAIIWARNHFSGIPNPAFVAIICKLDGEG